MVLPLKLHIQLVGIAVVQVNKRCFRTAIDYLTQAAARGLQHHICGTIALLGKNDSGKTSAVPPLFTNLYKQYDTDFGY